MLLNPLIEARVGSRSAERVRLEVMIDARAAHSRLRAEVLDCSSTGVRLRTLNPLKLGQTYWLKLPGLELLAAEVVWVNGFTQGAGSHSRSTPGCSRA
jgi:hypothetical protein